MAAKVATTDQHFSSSFLKNPNPSSMFIRPADANEILDIISNLKDTKTRVILWRYLYHFTELLQSTCAIAALGLIPPRLGYAVAVLHRG